MSDSNKHFTMATDVELVSVTAAKMEDGPRLLLNVRMDPEDSFESFNMALTADQAVRLKHDLDHLFHNSELMKKAAKDYEHSLKYFLAIMNEEPPVQS